MYTQSHSGDSIYDCAFNSVNEIVYGNSLIGKMYNILVLLQLVFTLCIHIYIKIVLHVNHVNSSCFPVVGLWCCLFSWWHLACLSIPSTHPFHSKLVLSHLLTVCILPPPPLPFFFRSPLLPFFLLFSSCLSGFWDWVSCSPPRLPTDSLCSWGCLWTHNPPPFYLWFFFFRFVPWVSFPA